MKRTIRNFKETVEIRSSLLVRLRSSRYAPMVLLTGVVLAAACVHIWQRVHVLDLVSQTSQLKKENAVLADDARKVYSDVLALSMSTRIHAYAADSLGLRTVAADGLYTLVPEDDQPRLADDFDVVATAFKRVRSYLPSVTQTQASAGELRNPLIDSLANRGAGR